MQTKFPIRAESGAADTLASIAMISKTNVAEIKPLSSNLYAFMTDALKGVLQPDPEFAYPDGRVETSRPGFPGLTEDAGLQKALQHLDQKYQQVIRQSFFLMPLSVVLQHRTADLQIIRNPPWKAQSLHECISANTEVNRVEISGLHNAKILIMQ